MAETITNRLQSLEMVSISISRTNPRKTIDQEALKDLSESIKQKGVLQPILVRPIDGTNMFELVCGERRFRASQKAGLEFIPANIRELSDDEAFELQIIENLERKDVHPLDEADAFNKMMESGKYTVADIAAKMVKTETFIAQRLKLIDLIDDLREDFKKNHFGIGHAILLARLSKEDQEGVYKHARNKWSSSEEYPDYGTVADLKGDIEEDQPDLSKAIFPLDKDNVVLGCVSCNVCAKRTKSNPVLFADMQDEDLCMEGKCFENKTQAFIEAEVGKIISEGEGVYICSTNDKPSETIISACKEFNVPILKEYQDFQGYNYGNHTKVKGYYVSGYSKGQYKDIYIKESLASSSKDGVTSEDVQLKEELSKVESRAERALELDQEKIWAAIRDMDKSKFLNASYELSNNEKVALAVALGESAWEIRKESAFLENITVERILKDPITDVQLNEILRLFILNKLSSTYGNCQGSNHAAALKQVLEEYYPEEIKTIEVEHQEKANKRIARTDEKMRQLKAKLKSSSKN